MTTGTPIKRRTQTDPEIKAIQKVLAIVDDLPSEARRRVLEYALSRLVTRELMRPATYSGMTVSSNRATASEHGD